MNKKFYITTPIYYVNDRPHIGHTYTTVAADVLARYHRMIGEAVYFSVGTDEHGAKIEAKAKEQGQDPKAFVDEVASAFEMAWDELNISNNRFIRTTEPDHIRAVKNALMYMKQKGDIYQGKYEGLYCQGCEQYKSEKDLIDGLCPDHKTAPQKMSEETYLFRLSKYVDILKKKIGSDELKIRPKERKNEILAFYNEEIKDISFSRKNVKWGITLPWRASHTAYVWADAFLNYLTILNWRGNGPKLDNENLKTFWPPNVQLMSKDILRVHATIWPAMLLSLDLPLMHRIYVHGFFLFDGHKMSKSVGNIIAPGELTKKYGVDGTRYLLMSATPFGHDGDIGWGKFDDKYNADLANGLGNLAARLSTMADKLIHEKGLLVKSKPYLDFKSIVGQYMTAMADIKIDEALNIVWNALKQIDKHITEHEPWKLIGQDNQYVGELLYADLESLRVLSYLLWPFMPETAENLWQRFGFDPGREKALPINQATKWGRLDSKSTLTKAAPLFPRIS